MKKILVSMFLLVFGLCLVGCNNFGISNNSIIELGTCKVTVVDYDNRDVYVLCYDIEENSLGEMVITISNGIGTVTSISGEITNIIELNTTAEIVE